MQRLSALAALLAVPFLSVQAGSVPKPSGLESGFLGLNGGSLVESIYFRMAWLRTHPTEDSIILTATASQGQQTSVAGVAVYTKLDKVFAHSVQYGTVPLISLQPADLDDLPKVRAAYQAAVGSLSAVPVLAAGSSNEQVIRAYASLHNQDVCGNFPVTLSSASPSPTQAAYGLVFDWNQGHYIYHPGGEALLQPQAINPLTGTTAVSVRYGDLVDSVIFAREYFKTHPAEKTRVVYLPKTLGEKTDGYAGAAYTLNGALWFHSVLFGEKRSDRLTAADIDEPKINDAYHHLVDAFFTQAWQQAQPGQPAPNQGRHMLFTRIPNAIPSGLSGDTGELQLRRVYQRAQALGLPSDIVVWQNISYLVLCWGSCRYVYNAATGSQFNGMTQVETEPNRFVDALLFAHDYARKHPEQKVVAVPFHAAGTTKVKGLALYSKDGQVFAHDAYTGENAFANFAPADLGNPEQYKHLREEGNRLIKTAIEVVAPRKNAQLAGLDRWTRPDTSGVEVAGVSKQLLAAGIPCQLSATTQERAPDGTVRCYATASLTFQYWGVTYTYGEGRYCTASNGVILLPN